MLHVLALANLAISQPMLHRIQGNPAYLRLERMQSWSVLIAVVAVILLPTVIVGLIRWLVQKSLGEQWAWRFHCAVIFFCISVVLLTWMMWTSRVLELMSYGVPESLFLIAALVWAGILIRSYVRSSWLQQFAEFSVIGVLLFPAALFSNEAVRAVLWPQPSALSHLNLRADKPCDVIMIVMDGVCGMSFLDAKHNIDSVRYPSFARLAAHSNWYRNASTVHYRTDQAVPAMLTGRMPQESAPGPVESSYPDNLFRILYETHQFEMTVFEPLTRLCPEELLANLEPISIPEQCLTLLRTVGTVCLKTALPNDMFELRIAIPHRWFGLASSPDVRQTEELRQGLIIYPWSSFRDLQFNHLLNCLYPRSRPGFHFLHVVAPHDPWSHLPSGKIYLDNPSYADFPQGALGQLGELWSDDPLDSARGWQRHLLQLQWVDTQLGRILDQLEQSGMLNECLLVVTADHGMAFRAGANRREPANTTLPDILSVPLFIKYPNQLEGFVDDQNVEIIDILPTIFDVLKLRTADEFDGQSLHADNRAHRPRKTLVGTESEIITDSAFEAKFDVVDRMLNLFGAGTDGRLVDCLNIRPELVGRRLDEFSILQENKSLQIQLKSGGGELQSGIPNLIPCYIQARLLGSETPDKPIEIAVVVNDVLYATTRTSSDHRLPRLFSALLPEDAFISAHRELLFFQIIEEAGTLSLQQIPLE